MKFLLLVTIFLCYASSTTSLTDQYLDSYEEYNILSSEEDENHENKNLSVEGCKVNYKYTIWIGDAVDETCSIKLQSECGTNFFDAMKQASQVEKQFDFEYTTHPAYGAFVTKIAGVSNNKEENSFWMIYCLPRDPEIDNPPGDELLSPVGVSSLKVLDGNSYLFWYKTVNPVVDNTELDIESNEDYYN